MPYRSNDDLPLLARDHLPAHAQDIYREAFNHCFAAHADDTRQEEISHRTAWRRRGSFLRMRQPQRGIAPRLVCDYREQISQAFAAVHQRLIRPIFNERGGRLPKCLRLLALPRGIEPLFQP
ncbi:hypothetical protein AS156_29215 [Bradyrhizobium macuxiense]|uniref:Uncharacterized protein n=1 Tax=Bradyrhizobium macuxiense TaxID=1755647 RepID=A0A109K439_9BRAD|nr:hypothetical protein AS156_29215 [Bradyrhizobium macuxiense]